MTLAWRKFLTMMVVITVRLGAGVDHRLAEEKPVVVEDVDAAVVAVEGTAVQTKHYLQKSAVEVHVVVTMMIWMAWKKLLL